MKSKTVFIFFSLMLAATVWVVLSGCGSQETPTDITSTDGVTNGAVTGGATTGAIVTTTTPPATGPSDVEVVVPGAPFGSEQVRGGTAEVQILKEIRFGDQAGFERVVLEFTGQAAGPNVAAIPRYRLSPGTLPYSDSGGINIAIAGSNYLELLYNGNVTDATVVPPVEVYRGPRDFSPGLTVVRQARFVSAYENNSLILLIGLSGAALFRVSELTDPPRIVIDIKK